MIIEERGLVVSEFQDVPRSSQIMRVDQTFDTQTRITHFAIQACAMDDAAPLEEEMIS
jgi:hypothetical protein